MKKKITRHEWNKNGGFKKESSVSEKALWIKKLNIRTVCMRMWSIFYHYRSLKNELITASAIYVRAGVKAWQMTEN